MIDKIKIHGVEFNVASQAEAEQCDVVVCMLVRELPIPERISAIERCAVCNERIWVSSDSPKKPPRWCIICATKKITERADGGNKT